MLKHLNKSDPEPQVDHNKLVFYTYQFCPYARRVALTLYHYDIEHQKVLIDLRNKPDWYLNINPPGKVPMIEHNGERMLESDVICRYLDEYFGNSRLMTVSGEEKMKLITEWWNKIFKSYYALACEKTFSKEMGKTYLSCLEDFEKFPGSKFISGDEVGLADFIIYPFLESINICLKRIKHTPLPNNPNYPRLNAWFQSMNSTSAVQKEKISEELHNEMRKSLLNISSED